MTAGNVKFVIDRFYFGYNFIKGEESESRREFIIKRNKTYRMIKILRYILVISRVILDCCLFFTTLGAVGKGSLRYINEQQKQLCARLTGCYCSSRDIRYRRLRC